MQKLWNLFWNDYRLLHLQVSGTETECFIDELQMSTGYVVRIAAQNKYGVGDFAECPEFLTATPFKAPIVEEPPVISNVTEKVR